ncbi:glycine cleavage system protein H [Kitasatospora sp. NBC_00070]|uniref:glycine cleavage system protein H n=1 Tax=Kitasatospora sp. NBC_00070 TaxID=2975962 RepID=UPI0032476CAC
MYPTKFKYTQDHEWIEVTGKTAVVGITDCGQRELQDLTSVVMETKVDAQLEQGDHFCTVESVLAASDIHMPVAGKVIEINENLADDPESVNTEPHTTWFIKIEVSDAKQLDELLTAAQYEKFLAE